MKEIDFYLAEKGNYLSSVAEFARASDAGVFLNPATWGTVVLDLFPSASLYLVYVSNQSNGLMYEIANLLDRGLEEHTILVLDGKRFGSRASFFSMQEGLEAEGKHLYEQVVRDASAVEDPDAFERLLARFPHAVALTDDAAPVQREIEALIPVVRRVEAEAPVEVPFDFHVNLNEQQADAAADLRQRISDRIHAMASQQTISNWSVFLLYLQIDVFLSLTSGRPLDAALSTARCAAIANVVREHGEESDTPEETKELQLAGDIAMNVGYDAFALGEWNDYTDRRALSREPVDSAAMELGELMHRSISAAQRVVVRATQERPPAEDPDAHAQLATDLLTQFLRSEAYSGGTDRV